MFTPTEMQFDGLLFIGDPHVSSRRPGRRKDDYLASVLEKLAFCAQLCRTHNLLPVILGDLLHRNDDSNLKLLNGLVAALKQFPVPPLALEGNHDKEETSLTDADVLFLLAQTGVVQVITEPGLVGTYQVQGKPVRLFAAPYGSPIPKSVAAGEGTAVLITHHDMAFEGAYPGSLAIEEVKGVAMVVNGHMHDTKPSVTVGQTVWYNPGNIEPLSVDVAHHVPCAWVWNGEANQPLVAEKLPHGADLFDLTGLQVAAGDADAAVAALQTSSKFAEMIAEESAKQSDAERTDDVSVLGEDLEQTFGASGVSPATQSLLRALLGDVRSDALAA
ncbi:3',5'-cyclic adenosine monophosphate phosphodiesterase CpdA [compost metagenome]